MRKEAKVQFWNRIFRPCLKKAAIFNGAVIFVGLFCLPFCFAEAAPKELNGKKSEASVKKTEAQARKEFLRIQKQINPGRNLQSIQVSDDQAKDLKKLIDQDFILEEWVKYQLALYHFNQKKWSDTIEQLEPINLKTLNGAFANEINLLLAKAYLSRYQEAQSGNGGDQKNSDLEAARKLLLQLERRMRGADDLPQIQWRLAWIFSHQGKLTQACRYSQSVLTRFPLFPETLEWRFPWRDRENKPLRIAGRAYRCSWDFDEYSRRLRNLQLANQDEKANEEVKALAAAGLFSPLERVLLEAQLMVQNGDVADAKQKLKPKLEKFKDDVRLLNLLAQASARAGLPMQAVHYYRRIYELQPRTRQGEAALFQSGFVSYVFQNYDLAIKYFEEFRQKFPRAVQRQEVRWLLGWLRYLRKDYDLALSQFAELQTSFGRRAFAFPEARRIAYWRAMTLLRMGRASEAKLIFTKIEERPALDFYSMASRKRLAGLKEVSVGNSQSNVGAEESEESIGDSSAAGSEGAISQESVSLDAESGLDSVSSSAVEPANEDAVTSETSVANEEVPLRLRRARLLRESGLYAQARAELSDVQRRNRDRGLLRILIEEFELAEAYHQSSQLASRFVANASGRERNQLRQSQYPLAFRSEVEAAIKESGVPIEFVYAIMRAESSYRKDVVSPVGALGLMQIMPYTGIRLAALANQSDYKHQLLLQPEHSTRLGSLYLRRLLNQFEDNWALAAAAYNAGPHRVKTWLSQFGHLDLDEFVEHIPFRETRLYVKRVSVNAAQYQEIYQFKSLDFAKLAVPFHERLRNFTVVTKESWEDIN